jgi:hypothetical protein
LEDIANMAEELYRRVSRAVWDKKTSSTKVGSRTPKSVMIPPTNWWQIGGCSNLQATQRHLHPLPQAHHHGPWSPSTARLSRLQPGSHQPGRKQGFVFDNEVVPFDVL